MEHDVGEQHRDQNAQLIDGRDEAGRAELQRFVIAQPAGTRRQARQTDEAKLIFGHRLHLALLALHKHHDPCHDEHHAGAQRRTEIGLDPGDADLAQDRGQRRKNGRAERRQHPAAFLFLDTALFLDHQERADGDQHNADAPGQGHTLAQQQCSQQDRHDRAALVDGHDLIDWPALQGIKIAQPAGTRRQTRQPQEYQTSGRDAGNRPLRADHKHHDPRKNQHNDRADGRGHGGIRFANAAFCQNGCQTCEQRRADCVQ